MVCLLLFSLVLSCGDDNGTEPEVNNPPNAPTNPTPANGATNQPLDVNLSWECSDPDGDALTYLIAIVGQDGHTIADSNLTQPSYDPGPLHSSTLYAWLVIAMDEHMDTTWSPAWTFTTVSGNNPPSIPSNPSPANGATDQSTGVQLSWSCSDLDGDDLTYDIYFGTNPSPPLVQSDQSATTYNPGTLQLGTTYYWKIEADDGTDQTEGPTWSFTTASEPVNSPPLAPSDPSPADDATDQSTTVQLSWSCSDPDGDDLTYDVYFGTNSTPPLVQSNQSATTYDPGTLQTGTTYYWRIIADDGTDQTEGSVWSFSTVSPGVHLVGTYTTDEWANAVYVDGNYAYVGDGLDGLLIVNITNPSNPTLVGSYNTPSSARDVHKVGNFAYIADSQSGLQIINVSNPVNPLLAGNYNTTRADGVFVVNDYVYLTDRWDEALMILDVSSPSSPSLLGSYPTGDECRKVHVVGDYAYIANFDSGLLIVNISNPSSPSYVGNLVMPDQAHGLYVANNYVYVAAYFSGLQIIDVSDPSTPSIIGAYNTPEEAWNVVVDGDFAYLAAGAGGFNILDVSNPGSPTLEGGYTPAGSVVDVAVDDNYIYIVDGDVLYILEYIQ
jgi:hypothetical protein